jgi:hypothetical protein
MRRHRRLIVAVIALVAAACAAWWFIMDDGRAPFADKQTFSRGQYMAFAQPWGGDKIANGGAVAGSDEIRVDLARFPDNTGISWRWPLHRPTGVSVGVWGYNIVAFGAYDGGTTDVAVPPRRVKAIKALKQTFDWSYSAPAGDANLLTEFYLRSDPANSESKLIEIGWFLHTPKASAAFAAQAKPIGSYTDPQGRRWNVTMDERYCMFVPADQADIATGEIDMLAALGWLRTKRLVTGEEWFSGVAIGAEPVWGIGHVEIKHWAVTYN